MTPEKRAFYARRAAKKQRLIYWDRVFRRFVEAVTFIFVLAVIGAVVGLIGSGGFAP